jgi:hypothetical protein
LSHLKQTGSLPELKICLYFFFLSGIGTGNWLLQEGYMMKSSDVAGIHSGFRKKLIETIGLKRTDSMKRWGFNSLRVAMHYKWLTLPIEDEPIAGHDTWLEEGFVRLDSLADWCADNQMYLIFDLHGAPGGQGKDANISDYDPLLFSLTMEPVCLAKHRLKRWFFNHTLIKLIRHLHFLRPSFFGFNKDLHHLPLPHHIMNSKNHLSGFRYKLYLLRQPVSTSEIVR